MKKNTNNTLYLLLLLALISSANLSAAHDPLSYSLESMKDESEEEIIQEQDERPATPEPYAYLGEDFLEHEKEIIKRNKELFEHHEEVSRLINEVKAVPCYKEALFPGALAAVISTDLRNLGLPLSGSGSFWPVRLLTTAGAFGACYALSKKVAEAPETHKSAVFLSLCYKGIGAIGITGAGLTLLGQNPFKAETVTLGLGMLALFEHTKKSDLIA